MMATALLPGALRVAPSDRVRADPEFVTVDRRAFDDLRAEWNGVVETTGVGPFCRHEYIRTFVDNFGGASETRFLMSRDSAGHLESALPLLATRESIGGLPFRVLGSPTNVHSLRFDLLAGDSHGSLESAKALLDHLDANETWDVLRLTDIPQGGRAWMLFHAARAAGFPVGAWESQRSPYIALPRTFAELQRTLTSKFRTNLRRRRKRLDETGAVLFEHVVGDAISETLLEECFALESQGWKGRNGSSVHQSDAVHGFHRDLWRDAEFRPHLSLTLLRLGDRLIGFHYGHMFDGVYSLVITSYDENYKEFSPGHLLTEAVLEDCIDRGLREFDFLGCDLPWKLDWTTATRPHHWLFVFRKTLKGRAGRSFKFGWVKAAHLLLTNRMQ